MKKKMMLLWLLVVAAVLKPALSQAQANELAQLALNIEKLAQLKKILQTMYDGYKVITEGYNKVKDITSGNFKLHEVFLNGLYLVSPEVRKYHRVAEIISYQLEIVKSQKRAFKQFTSSDVFTPRQITYLSKVYKRLIDDSMQNLDELTLILTANKLRMSDDERMQSIDRIYQNVLEKWKFLRAFNNQWRQVGIQKIKENTELQSLRELHGTK